jgi:hypothetical protein
VPGDALDRLSGVYARFAANEARGRSAAYEELARGVAGDREMLRILAELPQSKQQPNLLFASVRYLCGVPTTGRSSAAGFSSVATTSWR